MSADRQSFSPLHDAETDPQSRKKPPSQKHNNPPRKREKRKMTLPKNVQAMPKLGKKQNKTKQNKGCFQKEEEELNEHVNPV